MLFNKQAPKKFFKTGLFLNKMNVEVKNDLLRFLEDCGFKPLDPPEDSETLDEVAGIELNSKD